MESNTYRTAAISFLIVQELCAPHKSAVEGAGDAILEQNAIKMIVAT